MNKKIRLWFLSLIPMSIAYVLAVFYMLPKHISGLSAVMPLVQLIPIYIWGVMHPRDVSFIGLAIMGLLIDVATGLPLGLAAMSYVLFFLLVRTQRKYIYREGFAPMWGYFAILLLAMQAASWGLYGFFYGQMAPIGNALLQWIFTVLAYPLFHFILYPAVEKLTVARYRLIHAT